jgi:signal transduction histidine kinase
VGIFERMHQAVRRASRHQPHADIAMAVVVFAVVLLTTATAPAGRLDTAVTAWAAAGCAALVVRRRFPTAAFLAAAGAAEAYLTMFGGHAGALVLAAPLIALYTLAERGSRRRALLISVLAVVALAGMHMLVRPSSWLGAENLALAAFGGLAVAAGDAARSRRAYLAEVEARAARAEADREADAARRVTDERLRIARDLHDVLGHQLALINVQAAVADHVLDADPAGSRAALAHIRGASRSALEELRDTIGLLRRPGEPLAPTEPTGGVAALPELYDSFRRAGLRIDGATRGTVRPLPAPVDLTAFRVVQEALTNVCKHAGPADVRVDVDYADDALRVTVANAPTGRPVAARDGHGLDGMRERVAALSGTLRAGARRDGGFRVAAVLPWGSP